MRRITILLLVSFAVLVQAKAQTAHANIRLSQGQTLSVTLQVKTTVTQQAMGQAIDFNVEATGDHSYKVTNHTDDNNTLHHQMDRVQFSFDGMGQKKKFDSREEKDINGQFGKPIKDMLGKSYDIIIDTGGTVLMAIPEKITMEETDSRMAIIINMLKDVFSLIQPPGKGKPSMFKILPDQPVTPGEKWSYGWQDENGRYSETYTLNSVNDSTILVDYAATSSTITKAEMMGNPTTTKMNNKTTGKIIIDRLTGILIEKNTSTESNGSTEGGFGDIPVTSKMTAVLKVTQNL